jgi:ribonucleoside-triphosphate reductase
MENQKENICHDCGKKIEINNEEIKDGAYLTYNNAGKKISVLKCNRCYEKNPALTNFQECEVYSRVVGYLRPVSQWHKGKKQEYGERQEYTMPLKDFCCD